MDHLGELAALTAALIWAGSLCTFRAWGGELAASTLTCFKALVALAGLAVSLAWVQPELPSDRTVWLLLGLSGLIGLTIGDTAFFAALKRLGAQRTASLQCLAPPLSALIALVFLDEHLSGKQTTGMTLTVAAVLGVIWSGRKAVTPGSAESAVGLSSGIAFAVLAALCQAIGLCLARPALQDTHVLVGTAMRFAPAVIGLLLIERFRPAGSGSLRDLTRDHRRLAVLSIASFAGTFVGVLLLTFGTKYAEAGVVTAISHTFPVWAVPIARYTIKETVQPVAVFWTLVAVAGVALTLL